MKDQYFEARGICYRVNEFKRDRKTIVFLHGLSGSLSAWEPSASKLSGLYNLLLIDLRGHGRSSRPRKYNDYDFSEFASDVDGLLRSLHIEKFVMVAYSFGTLVGLDYILRYPDKVSQVMLLSANYRAHRLWKARLSLPFLALISWIFDLWPFPIPTGKHLDYGLYLGTGDWSPRRIAADVSNTGIRPYLYCVRHVFGFRHDDLWGRISAPTLIVHGAKDSYIPVGEAVALTKEISGSKLAELSGAGHILPVNNSTDIIRLIRDFVHT